MVSTLELNIIFTEFGYNNMDYDLGYVIHQSSI